MASDFNGNWRDEKFVNQNLKAILNHYTLSSGINNRHLPPYPVLKNHILSSYLHTTPCSRVPHGFDYITIQEL